jgi:hypothetical protein
MRAHPIGYGCVERPHRPLEEQERRNEMLGTAKAFSGFSLDDIDAARGSTIAWFKDPAGNVLSVLEAS